MAHYVLVCGGRDITNDVAGLDVDRVLTFLKYFYGVDLRLIHGGAPGIDTLAGHIATHLEVTTKVYPADPGRGPGAVTERNRKVGNLLVAWEQKGHSVEVIAFPGAGGTAHMVDFAERLGINVTHMPLDIPQPSQQHLPGVGSE